MFFSKNTLSVLGSICLYFVVSSTAVAVPFGDVYVFGDSLSDSGNLFTATGNPPFPYYNGRFSNGPVYSEVLADNLGTGPLTPSLLGGTNFAWAGARSGTDVPLGGGLAIPSVNTQATAYLANQGGVATAGALHVVFGGGNDVADILDAGLNGVTGAAFVLAAVNNVLNTVDVLIGSSANAILVPNLPDLGLTPRFQGNDVVATELSNQFNTALAAGLFDRQTEVTEFDTFAFMHGALDGFLEQSAPCFNGVTVCANPDDYVFFDDFHPTALFHQQFADELTLALVGTSGDPLDVPEPGALMLFGLGIVGVLVKRKPRVANV